MSADDLEKQLKKKEEEEAVEVKKVPAYNNQENILDKFTKKHLMMMANRTKNVSRSAKKNKSSEN